MSGRWQRVGWACLGVAALAPGVWVVVKASGAATPEAFNQWAGWANILALPLSGLGTGLVALEKVTSRRATALTPASQDVEQILVDLARQLQTQWGEEAAYRKVKRPHPVLVSWSSSGRRAAERSVVLDETGATWAQLPLRGRLDGLNEAIVDAFAGLPHRQLMVLGEPGAGKSVFAMLLTLGLLHRPDPVAGLPVLFPINVWDPGEPVAAFVARRLAEDYARVLATYGDPEVLARRLVEHRRILPVLDGLDELPTEVQTRAVTALDEYAAADNPLVVTCRIREYERAVARGRVLSQAAVIELEPVGVEAAISYLSQPAPDPRWASVFEHLRAHPDGPLATVLSTPLMVALAGTAYQDFQGGKGAPGDLLGLPTTAQITGRLMDAFLTAAYTHPSPVRASAASGRVMRVHPEQARRWLATLAYQLDQAGTHDLQWWQIRPDLMAIRPDRVRTLTVAAAALIAAIATGLIAGTIGNGWTAGRASIAAILIVFLAAAGWLRPLWPRGYPPFVAWWLHLRVYRPYRSPRWRRLIRRGLGLAFGIGGGLLTGWITLHWAGPLTAGAVCGVATALLPSWQPQPRRPRPTPTRSLRLNHRNAATAAAQQGCLGVLVFYITAGIFHTSPSTAVIAGAVYATGAALSAGGWTWVSFRLTHVRLLWTKRLPRQFWAFLDDAHHRGVLRRAGSVYQLRHALLQEHLGSVALAQQSDAGDWFAARRLATRLAEQGRGDEAITLLQAWADTGAPPAARELARRLAEQGRGDEAITLLCTLADTGDRFAADQLVDLLAEQGRTGEAITLLRARVDADDKFAAGRLAELLGEQGCVDELRARADAGDGAAAVRLAELLGKLKCADELRTRADTGDRGAAYWLPKLLGEQGCVDELRARADAGNRDAARWLAVLLVQQGGTDELRARADAGDSYAANGLAIVLAGQGRGDNAITLLRAWADAGDSSAADQLADRLAEQGRNGELRARADAGDWFATRRLTVLLARQGRDDEAITLLRTWVDAGDWEALWWLAKLLARQGRGHEAVTLLRTQSDAGDRFAADQLRQLTTADAEGPADGPGIGHYREDQQ